jgi:hypothetical protein
VTETEHTLTETYTWRGDDGLTDGYIELRWDMNPHVLDEFICHHPNAFIHYEVMSDNHVWMAITIGDWSIDFNWGGKKLTMRAEVNI